MVNWQKMVNADTAGDGGSYFVEGLHLCRVDRIKEFTGPKPAENENAAIEFTVIKTIRHGSDTRETPNIEGIHHNPGDEVSIVWDQNGKWGYFQSQFRQFTCKVLGIDKADEAEAITEQLLKDIFDEEKQPLSGSLVLVKGWSKFTNSKKWIVKTNFESGVALYNIMEQLGGDADALRVAYPDAEGFKSLVGLEKAARAQAKDDGIEFKGFEL